MAANLSSVSDSRTPSSPPSSLSICRRCDTLKPSGREAEDDDIEKIAFRTTLSFRMSG